MSVLGALCLHCDFLDSRRTLTASINGHRGQAQIHQIETPELAGTPSDKSRPVQFEKPPQCIKEVLSRNCSLPFHFWRVQSRQSAFSDVPVPQRNAVHPSNRSTRVWHRSTNHPPTARRFVCRATQRPDLARQFTRAWAGAALRSIIAQAPPPCHR